MFVLSVNLRPGHTSVHLNYDGIGTARGARDKLRSPGEQSVVMLVDDYGHEADILVADISLLLLTDVDRQTVAQGEVAMAATKGQLRTQQKCATDPTLKLLQSEVQRAMQAQPSGLKLDS